QQLTVVSAALRGHYVVYTHDQDVLGARAGVVAAARLHRCLPPELAAMPPRERARHPAIAGVIEGSLAASPHRRFHPEADIESCRPDYVLASVDEVVGLVAGPQR